VARTLAQIRAASGAERGRARVSELGKFDIEAASAKRADDASDNIGIAGVKEDQA